MKACGECGDTMREVSYVNQSMQTTLYWCGWCAYEHTETKPIAVTPITPTAAPPDFRGIVKLEQTRIGFHGGKIHKRLW